MKKRFLIPFVALNALVGIAAIGDAGITDKITACNDNDKDACLDLVRVHGTGFARAGEITNPAYKEALKPLLDAQVKAQG